MGEVMKKLLYKDFYDGFATITEHRNGTFGLVVKTLHGKVTLKKDYRSLRGAKIAMGKLSDGWTEVAQQ